MRRWSRAAGAGAPWVRRGSRKTRALARSHTPPSGRVHPSSSCPPRPAAHFPAPRVLRRRRRHSPGNRNTPSATPLARAQCSSRRGASHTTVTPRCDEAHSGCATSSLTHLVEEPHDSYSSLLRGPIRMRHVLSNTPRRGATPAALAPRAAGRRRGRTRGGRRGGPDIASPPQTGDASRDVSTENTYPMLE